MHAYRYRVYLNEWRRFDRPGTYRIYCTSARVWKPESLACGRQPAPGNFESAGVGGSTCGQTADWQDRQLHMAVTALDRPAENTDQGQAGLREVLRRLRYLDTEAATCALARCQTGGNDEESDEIDLGLYEARFKTAAVEESQKLLDTPNFAVTSHFIIDLAALAADARLQIHYDSSGDDQLARKAGRARRKTSCAGAITRLDYANAAWAAAEHKTPLARARPKLNYWG